MNCKQLSLNQNLQDIFCVVYVKYIIVDYWCYIFIITWIEKVLYFNFFQLFISFFLKKIKK